MKILIVHNHYLNQGGEDEVVKAEMKMLEKNGHRVILYERFNSEINNSSIFHKLKFVFKDVFWSKKTYDDISKLIKEEKPDIAHIHNTFLSISPSVYYACYDKKVPVVQTMHNYRFLCPIGVFYRDGKICEDCLRFGKKSAIFNKCWKNSFFLSALLVGIIDRFYKGNIFSRYIDGFIVLSNFSKRFYEKNKEFENKISVKPNFIDFDVKVSKDAGKYGLYVGALRHYKGIFTLLKAWEKLDNGLPLKIIGDGYLREKVKDETASQEIQYLGQLSLQDTIKQIKDALFVVLPSECYENFPRIVIEAFACGVPVIASNCGALREIVDEKKTGLLFESQNHNDLIAKIKMLSEDKELLNKMKKNARLKYEEEYTMEKNYRQLMNIYNRHIYYKKDELDIELSKIV